MFLVDSESLLVDTGLCQSYILYDAVGPMEGGNEECFVETECVCSCTRDSKH